MNGRERANGRIAQREGQRTNSDHAQDLESVVLEGQSKGFEALVLSDEFVDVGGEDGAGG